MAKNSLSSFKQAHINKVYNLATAESFTFDPLVHDGICLILPTSYSGTITNTAMENGQTMTIIVTTNADPASWFDYPTLTASDYSQAGVIHIWKLNSYRYSSFNAMPSQTVFATKSNTLTLSGKTISAGTIKGKTTFLGTAISSSSAVSSGCLYKLASGYVKIKA